MKNWSKAALAGLAIAVSASQVAHAQDDDAICADRPGKAYANCTVPKGKVQVETDLYDQAFQTTAGQKVRQTFYSNPTLKYGLTDAIDVEAAIVPWQTLRTRDRVTGDSITQRGPGDLTLQAKLALSKTLTLMPFVTAPTATNGLGNGGWGGGLRAPIQFELPGKGWSLSLTPELDVVRDETGGGNHLQHVEVIGVNKDLGRGVTLSIDAWGQWNYDPSGESDQASIDLDVAWVPQGMKSIQLDAQVNFGLTRDTPDTQFIVGISKRF